MKKYHILAKVSLVCVFLIIVAGSVVRMTGSGMGCPDWPKCFGYYIPPTSETDILFKPNHHYKKGQVIQINGIFHFAKEDFKSSQSLDINNWQKNTKHNYNTFNVTHTWVEFINRQVSVIAGIPILLLFIISILNFKRKKLLFVIALTVIFLMGFQAWLGKTVVDSNLLPVKISIHLVVAYLIVLTLVLGLFKSKNWHSLKNRPNNLFKNILIISVALTTLQIFLGIQVRQYVDLQIKANTEQSLWLQNPEISFYIHRTFSIIILLINLWLYQQNKKKILGLNSINFVVLIILLEAITGISMLYFDFPMLTQPIHLVLSGILLCLQFFIILRVFFTPKTNEFVPLQDTIKL